MVTCGLSRFTRVFPCNKKITGEQTVKMLVEQWFEPYGAPKQVHSDEDVRIRSDTGWCKRVLNALNVEVTTGVPYTHTSNPLCERQNRVVEQNLRILMKQERTKDWVRLVPWAVLSMNSQRSSSTGFTPHELFHGGRPAWFFKTPFPEDFKSPVGDWLEHKQSLANQAGTNLRHIRDREQSRRNRLRRPASFKVGDLVLVHHSRLPSWPRNCLQDPYFGPYRIIRIDGSRIHVRCSPRLGGELLCAPKQLRHYHSPDDLSWDEWRLSDSEIERIDLENAASRDAGSNSHECARIRIRPEFARIRGPLRIRIRNFKFEFPLDSLEFPRGLESIGTYNLPSPVCICPLPYGIKHFKSKSFHNLAIFVVCCCLHSPCLNYLTKIKTNQNEEFQISMYTPFLDSFKYLLEKKQQSMQNHQSTHKPSHVNHFLPLLGLHSLYSCIES